MAEQSIGALASKIINVWEWYQKALANPSAIGGKELPVHEAHPKPGYFRVRRKDGHWEPVAIYYPEDSATLVAYRDGREVRDINSLWVWCCRNPVEFDAYEAAMDGQGWADEPEAAPGIGDNSSEADPFDALRIEYLGEKEQAEAFMKETVTTQAQADKVGIWAKRLTAIKTKAEGLHKVEKQPHLDAGRAVDDKWRDLKTEPDDLAKKLKAHIQPFLSAKLRAEQERARKAAEESDRLRREAHAAAEAARSKANEQSVEEFNQAQQERADLLLRAQQADQASEVRNATAGRTGSKVGIRVEKRAKIIDFQACLMALKDRPEIIELVTSLANRAVKSGFPLPGVEVEQFEKVV